LGKALSARTSKGFLFVRTRLTLPKARFELTQSRIRRWIKKFERRHRQTACWLKSNTARAVSAWRRQSKPSWQIASLGKVRRQNCWTPAETVTPLGLRPSERAALSMTDGCNKGADPDVITGGTCLAWPGSDVISTEPSPKVRASGDPGSQT